MRFRFALLGAAALAVTDPATMMVKAREATALGNRREAEDLYRRAIAELEDASGSERLLVEALSRLSVLLWFHPQRERREEARVLLSRAADLTPSRPNLWHG